MDLDLVVQHGATQKGSHASTIGLWEAQIRMRAQTGHGIGNRDTDFARVQKRVVVLRIADTDGIVPWTIRGARERGAVQSLWKRPPAES